MNENTELLFIYLFIYLFTYIYIIRNSLSIATIRMLEQWNEVNLFSTGGHPPNIPS